VSSSSTDALAPVINKALEAGIPVVTFNTDNPASNRLTFVGQDLVYSGVVMGDTLVKAMGEKGKILIFTVDAAAQWSKDREKGARCAGQASWHHNRSSRQHQQRTAANLRGDRKRYARQPRHHWDHFARLLQLPRDRPIY
jgi:ABC-type sugar transport system substrate-binding protein